MRVVVDLYKTMGGERLAWVRLVPSWWRRVLLRDPGHEQLAVLVNQKGWHWDQPRVRILDRVITDALDDALREVRGYGS